MTPDFVIAMTPDCHREEAQGRRGDLGYPRAVDGLGVSRGLPGLLRQSLPRNDRDVVIAMTTICHRNDLDFVIAMTPIVIARRRKADAAIPGIPAQLTGSVFRGDSRDCFVRAFLAMTAMLSSQ